MSGLDDLLRQIEEDELQDALEIAREQPELVVLTPIKYARARGIYPQRVYAAIRNGKLAKTHCPCGALIVDVAAADTLFGFSREVSNALDDSGRSEG